MRWAGYVEYKRVWCRNLKEGDCLEDLRHIWEDNIKMDVKETVCKGIIGLIWLRIETSVRLF
jgi:hypothetical protein